MAPTCPSGSTRDPLVLAVPVVRLIHLSLSLSFQADWCHAVKQRSEHSSVEKTIRVILDYYQKACQDDAEAEQHGQRAALGSSGRACWLWAARRSQDRGQPTERPASASGARASHLQSRPFHLHRL